MNGFLTKILRKEYFYEERSIYGKKYSRIAWIKISFPKETINPLLPMLSITKHYTAKRNLFILKFQFQYFLQLK